MLWEDNYLAHFGIKGQRWGIRRFQNEDGTLTPAGKERYSKNDTLFVSGSSKTQDKQSGYYRGKLPKAIRSELDAAVKSNSKIVVGDAPGIDRQVQDYLNKKKYSNVEVYGPGSQVRYSANKQWKTNAIDDPDHEPMSKEWLAKKDKAMTDTATKGLAVILDDGAQATRNNVLRLLDQNKDVKVYKLNKEVDDSWFDPKLLRYQEGARKAKSDIEAYKKLTNEEDKKKAAVEMLDFLDEQNRKHDSAIYETSRNGTDMRPYDEKIKEYNERNAIDNAYRDEIEAFLMAQVNTKSMDGYEGIPKSDRQKALYDYDPAPYGEKSSYDSYANWIPKYTKTKEYKDSEKALEKALNDSGLNDARDLWYSRGKYKNDDRNITINELDRRRKILEDAENKFNQMAKEALSVQNRLEKQHDRKIMRNALLDMGWPVTEKYMKIIENFIWYD